MILKKLITYLKLFRLPGVLIMNMFLFLPIYLLSRDMIFSLLQVMPFTFMIAGEIALNDCCDVEKDKINKPHRPLVRGNIDINKAMITAALVITLGLFGGIAVYSAKPYRLLCFLIVTAMLSFYNIKHPVIPLIKTCITATATVISLAFVYTYTKINAAQYFFLGAAFFFILGRELLMDIRDIDGDRANNYNTLAVVTGTKRIIPVSQICFILSVINAIFMVTSDFSYLKPAILLCAIFIIFYLFRKFVHAANSKEQNRVILLFWLPMLLMLTIQII